MMIHTPDNAYLHFNYENNVLTVFERFRIFLKLPEKRCIFDLFYLFFDIVRYEHLKPNTVHRFDMASYSALKNYHDTARPSLIAAAHAASK